MRHTITRGLVTIGLMTTTTLAQSNIDVTNKSGWGENVGWTNWRDADATNAGIIVGPTFMGGSVWGENVGFISLGDGAPDNGVEYTNLDGSDFGVNIEADGKLHGLAWGENIGWINFDGGAMAAPPQAARIGCADPPGSPLARLTGFVWGENVGWINLSSLTVGKFVSVDAATTPIDCDMNHDGVANGADTQLFVEFVMMTASPDWRDVCSGDVEATPNNLIDVGDVKQFVACMLTP